MADFVASVDAGNGGTNAVLAKPNGGYKSHYEPSVRAAATGASLGLGEDLELQYSYVDWYGYRYITGDDVLRVTRRSLERHMGANRYGNEFHQFMVAVSLAKLGVKEGTVDLTLFAPPGMYVDLKPLMQERFLENGGEVQIKLKGDKKPRTWRYEDITIWPEGIGAAACFVVDDDGEFVTSDVLSGDTVVLDLGAHTLDALQLRDGNFNPEALEHATWENGGVHTHIREPILRVLKKKHEDFATISVDDVDRVIRLGLVSEDYTLRVAGYEVNLEPLVEKHRQRYAEWLTNNLDGAFNSFRGIKSIILVGGGAVLVEDYLREWYGSKILDRKKYPTTRKVHPVDMNAVGGLRFALMRLKKAKPALR
jgi:hypothetical protein